MSVAACADLVRRGDPDRFLAAMAAPVAARGLLFPLYAFNLEVARAPWVTAEPLIAEMRLQWWRDALAEIGSGAEPRAHEVVRPLAAVIGKGVPVSLLAGMIDARRWDIARESFAGTEALVAHLDATGGGLMWAAALALGAPPGAEAPVCALARAAALAGWLRAAPALEAAGLQPLPDPDPAAVAGLARRGLGWIAEARRLRSHGPPAVRPALYPAWLAGPVLRRAVARPERVAAGALGPSDFARRGRLLWQVVTGRW